MQIQRSSMYMVLGMSIVLALTLFPITASAHHKVPSDAPSIDVVAQLIDGVVTIAGGMRATLAHQWRAIQTAAAVIGSAFQHGL